MTPSEHVIALLIISEATMQNVFQTSMSLLYAYV